MLLLFRMLLEAVMLVLCAPLMVAAAEVLAVFSRRRGPLLLPGACWLKPGLAEKPQRTPYPAKKRAFQIQKMAHTGVVGYDRVVGAAFY